MMYQWFNQKKRKEMNGPTAAVIRYDENEQAPTVVAHGSGNVARRIIELAQESNIPLQEDVGLIENLIDMDLGESIPPQLYSVIADILLMIEEMESQD